jgi:hypothetical protein
MDMQSLFYAVCWTMKPLSMIRPILLTSTASKIRLPEASFTDSDTAETQGW